LAVGDTVQAHEQFVEARDLDALRFRADSRLNEIIREIAAQQEGADVHLVDTAEIFASSWRDQNATRPHELFYEHVHLTLAGNYLMAERLLPKVVELLPPGLRAQEAHEAHSLSLAECAEQLVYTDWNEYRNLTKMLMLMDDHPFPNQLDHAQKYAQLEQRHQRLFEAATQEVRQQTFEAYVRAVKERPDDLLLRSNFISLLKDVGQHAAAGREAGLLMRTQPPHDWYHPETANQNRSVGPVPGSAR
jgi:hypothetical protein